MVIKKLAIFFKSFPLTTNLLQMTLKTCWRKYEKISVYECILIDRSGEYSAKGDIAYYEQFIPLSQCFQNLLQRRQNASL